MALFDTFVGLEVHIHLLTKTKVFCDCTFSYGAPPNTHVCPVCLGYPGVLPSVNREALKFAYLVGKTLNCTLSKRTFFERKNYFYPDMAKNYQITQFQEPVGRDGWFEFETDGKRHKIRIHDVHLEEDAGKMIHEKTRSLIDYNRAGTSLLEIVTEPDLKSGKEAEDFLHAFRRMVRYLGVCDGNMEDGSLRCDANISINKKGKGLGTKVEMKNLNSSRNVKKALRYEEKRQARAIKTGTKIIQETRLWDADNNKSVSMRTKETAHDYRYFPEPDIPPFCPDKLFMHEVEAGMIELPIDRRARAARQYGLSSELASFITDEKDRADFYEEVIAAGADAQESAKWLKGDVLKALGKRKSSLSSSTLSAERFTSLMKLLGDGIIHANIARQLLDGILDRDEDPTQIIEEDDLLASKSDAEDVRIIVQRVIDGQPKAVQEIRSGNNKAVSFLMGMVMRETKGSADPAIVRTILTELVKR